jgi:O-antigen/teichoic acid export membrane protein
VDVFSLVFGLLFVGAALIWGLANDPGSAVDGWPLPVLLIAVGAAGLVTSLGGWRRRRARTDPAEGELG